MFLLHLQTSTDLQCLEKSVKIPQGNREGLLWYEPDLTPPSWPINTSCPTFSPSTFTCATLSSFLSISFFEKLLLTLRDADSCDPALPGLTHPDVCLDGRGLRTICSHLHEIRRPPIMSACSTRPDSEAWLGTGPQWRKCWNISPTCLLSPWVTSPCKVGGLLGGSLSRAQLPLRNQDHDHTWPVFADSCEGQPRRLTKSLGKNPNSSTEGMQILTS